MVAYLDVVLGKPVKAAEDLGIRENTNILAGTGSPEAEAAREKLQQAAGGQRTP